MILVTIVDERLIIRGHAPREEPDHEIICAAVSATAQMMITGLTIAGVPETAFSDPQEHGGEIIIDLSQVDYADRACRVVMTAGVSQLMAIQEARPAAMIIGIDLVETAKYFEF